VPIKNLEKLDYIEKKQNRHTLFISIFVGRIEGLQEKVKGRPPMTIWMFRHKYYDSTGKRWKKKKSGFKIEKAALKALMEVNAATLRGETKHIG